MGYLRASAILLAAMVVGLPGATSGQTAEKIRQRAAVVKKSPEAWLAWNLGRFHTQYDIYTDAGAAGNHFLVGARMNGGEKRPGVPEPTETELAAALPPMVSNAPCPSRPGECIKVTFVPRGHDWGGWYFMNGVFPDPRGPVPDPSHPDIGLAPGLNFGTEPNAGVKLTGATTIHFYAAGAKGRERIDFFALGVGYDEFGKPVPDAPYRETSRRAPQPGRDSLKRLSKTWREFTISLTGGRDLTYVLGGFGWAASAKDNGIGDNVEKDKKIEFYLDDITIDLARPKDARFPLSYETLGGGSAPEFATVMRNVSFTYDAAAALIAFIAVGDLDNAHLVADALIGAQQHDRFYSDGRLRNAYQAGDLYLPPGWLANGKAGTTRMPGWFDTKDGRWHEDLFQVSTHTGNIAWAMLGLLSYYEATAGRLTPQERAPYLSAVVRLANWLDDERGCNCRHSARGYTAGWTGWEPAAGRPGPTRLAFRATEHNLDLYAAFRRLAAADRDNSSRWTANAEHAFAFVDSMWDGKRYLTGTKDAGNEPNTDVIPVDTQAWSVLALGPRAHIEALQYARDELAVGDGFAFSSVSKSLSPTAIWYEGTAQMSLAYRLGVPSGTEPADRFLATVMNARNDAGAVPAASENGVLTGFDNVPGSKWLLYNRPHTGATAWAVYADRRFNPFAPATPR